MARAFDMNRIDEWDIDNVLGPDPGPTEADRQRSRLAKGVTTPKKLEEAEKREARRAEKDAKEDARRAEARQRREARRLVDPDTGEIIEVEQLEIIDVREVDRPAPRAVTVYNPPMQQEGGPRRQEDLTWPPILALWLCVGLGLLALRVGSTGLLMVAVVSALPLSVWGVARTWQWIREETRGNDVV